VLPGLASFARAEIEKLPQVQLGTPSGTDEKADAVRFSLPAAAAIPVEPRTVRAVNVILTFAVPRPKALLGDENLRRVSVALQQVVQRAGARAQNAGAQKVAVFQSLTVDAAGRSSPVMQRLTEAFAAAVQLPVLETEGDLKVRVRPQAPGDGPGWQVLIRTTPRPLSARGWRVRNLPGGLNACVAAAVWQSLGATREQRVLNLMCGSGTLLIERGLLGPAATLVGLDLSEVALEASRENLAAAGVNAELVRGDATATLFEDASFDVVVCDPPWGDAHGDVANLHELYEGVLTEASRLLGVGGRLVMIVHALKAFERAQAAMQERFIEHARFRVFHGGHWPAVVELRRTGETNKALLDSKA